MTEIQILSIEKVKQNQYRISWEGDELLVPRDVLVKWGLYKGMLLSASQMIALKEAIDFFTVYQKSLTLLSGRAHFISQLRVKLRQRDYQADVIDAVLMQLEAEGLLNDDVTASDWVEHNQHRKSPRLMRAFLLEQGVSPLLVNSALEEVAVSPEELAREMIEKKARQYPLPLESQQREKVLSYLMRKGFDYPVAKRALATYEENGFDNENL